jgi:16S rRNA (cytosine967-C5)-methyltransferase
MNVSPARECAFEVLRRVEQEAAYAGTLLTSSRYEHLSREDHALAHELTLGVLRWRAQLDFFIEHFSRRKIAKLDAAAVIALRLGLYQLLFLTRTPAHAAINESVNLVKANKLKSAAPFVNAVLRNAQRAGAGGLREIIETIKDPLARLSVETSHPAWLLQRWMERLGDEEAHALAIANNDAPRIALRFNPRRASEAQTRAWLDEHGIGIRASSLTPGAFVIESGSLSGNAEPVREGWLYLQDEASQLVAHLAATPHSALRTPHFLDLCAAPGGKTTLAASLLPADAEITACDLHAHRLRTMEELAARLGVTNLKLRQLDAAAESPFDEPGQFDLVLLDAPCTGLGTLQRHPEIKWRANEAKVNEMAVLQRRLITNAAAQVRPGGMLTFSVCSTEPEEGEDVVAWFRDGHSEFRDMTRERLTELGLDAAQLLTATHGARTFTHRHGAESFFACVLWKRR